MIKVAASRGVQLCSFLALVLLGCSLFIAPQAFLSFVPVNWSGSASSNTAATNEWQKRNWKRVCFRKDCSDGEDACYVDLSQPAYSDRPVRTQGEAVHDGVCEPLWPGHPNEELYSGVECHVPMRVLPKSDPKNSSLFPRRIFQTWKGTNLGPAMLLTMRTWLDLNPDFQYEFFDDAAMDAFVQSWQHPRHSPQQVEDVREAWRKIAQYRLPGAAKADFWRYLVLFKHGGVYVDADCAAVLPVSEWFGKRSEAEVDWLGGLGMISEYAMGGDLSRARISWTDNIAPETANADKYHKMPLSHFNDLQIEQYFSRPDGDINLAQHVLAFKPNHAVLEATIAEVVHNLLTLSASTLQKDLIKYTGPEALARSAASTIRLRPDVRTRALFYPGLILGGRVQFSVCEFRNEAKQRGHLHWTIQERLATRALSFLLASSIACAFAIAFCFIRHLRSPVIDHRVKE